MKKTIKTMAVVLMTVVSLLISNDASANKINKTENSIDTTKKTVTVNTGKKVTLKVAGSYKNYTFKSNNKKVATVTKKGVVKGKKVGTATITAKSKKKVYKFKVKVRTINKDILFQPTIAPTEIPIETPSVENLKSNIFVKNHIYEHGLIMELTNNNDIDIPHITVNVKALIPKEKKELYNPANEEEEDRIVVSTTRELYGLAKNKSQFIGLVTFNTPEEVNKANGNNTPLEEWLQGVKYKDIVIEYTLNIDFTNKVEDYTDKCTVNRTQHKCFQYDITKPDNNYIEGCVRIVFYNDVGEVIGTSAYNINKYTKWNNNKTTITINPIDNYAEYRLHYNFYNICN